MDENKNNYQEDQNNEDAIAVDTEAESKKTDLVSLIKSKLPLFIGGACALIAVIVVALILILGGDGGSGESGGKDDDDHKHEYGDWVVVSEANCTHEGVKEKKCSCGKTKKGTIPTNGEHDLIENCGELSPTCTENGYKNSSKCSACGESFGTGEVIPALGHSLDDWIIDVMPSAAGDGHKYRACLLCDEIVEEESIPYVAIDYLEYEVDEYGMAMITGLKYNVSEVTIPAFIDGYEVYGVAVGAFDYNYYIEKVVIEEGVQDIAEFAFMSCIYLNEVELPETLYSIRNEAFSECTSLTSIVIPDSVEYLGGYIFNGCTSLVSIELPDEVNELGSGIFYNCYSLISVELPVMLYYDEVPHNIFQSCSSLRTVTVKGDVNSINSGAFAYCNSLESVYLPAGITYITGEAFNCCFSLSDIYFDGSMSDWLNINIENIGNDSLNGVTVHCSDGNLTNELLPEYFTYEYYEYDHSPDGSSFRVAYIVYINYKDYNKHYPTELTVPEEYMGTKVIGIGNYAFEGCSTLETINIPDTIEFIGYGAFEGCSSLETINIPDGITELKDGLFMYCESLESITIPSSVEYIGNSAFLCCRSLVSINIPDSVKTIGERAFNACESLSSIELPYGITSMGDGVFESCYSLVSVEIPNSVESLGIDAFYACTSLTDVKLSSSMHSILNSTFEECYALERVTIPVNITTVCEKAFYNCTSLSEIYYGGTIYDCYNTMYVDDYNESLFGVTIHCSDGDMENNIGFRYDYTTGGYSAYVYGDCVETITEAIIPEAYNGSHVTSIYEYGFYGCTNLERVVIPSMAIVIHEAAFMECRALQDVEFTGNKLTNIGDSAFAGCTSITSIELPSSVEYLGELVFNACENLESIVIPDGVNDLLYGLFLYCYELETIVIPNQVWYVGDYVFYGCLSLTDVYYKGNESNVESIYFGTGNDSLFGATIHYNCY